MPTSLNFRTLDLNLLRVFDVVMSERKLTSAADRLSITQSIVSNALKILKHSVCEDLLTRRSSGVKPTPRAEALWPEVRTTLGNLRAALANLRLLPLTTRDPSQWLARDEVDLAVGHFPEAAAALSIEGADASLRHLRLHESDCVCVMRQGHPLATGELTLDAYCATHHLLVSVSGRANGRADQALAELNRERRVVLTVNQCFTAGRGVAKRNLLTVLPGSFVNATGFREKVVTRPLPFILDSLHMTMLWHRRHDRVSSHEWLRARLVDATPIGA
jgi:DNA-binding transcriptional LysR family regulator